MRAKSFEGMACSIAMVLDAVGDRWAMLVLRDLVLGLRRYDDLRRSTGITNATLADRLKLLEQNGLIERLAVPERAGTLRIPAHGQGPGRGAGAAGAGQVGDKWRAQESEEPPLCIVSAQTGGRVRLGLVDGAAARRCPRI